MAKRTFVNNTSRLRKFVCGCQEHVTNDSTGSKRKGPQITRAAGDLKALCPICQQMFKLLDEPATRKRTYRGCGHCSNPSAHTHDSGGNVLPMLSDDEPEDEDAIFSSFDDSEPEDEDAVFASVVG